MPGWRQAMRHLVTVKRGEASTSLSGSVSVDYAVVLAGVPCSVQDAGGRVRDADVGTLPGRRKSVTFGPEMAGVVLQNDLIELENVTPGEVYKLTHVHVSVGRLGSHVEAVAEHWAPAGGV